MIVWGRCPLDVTMFMPASLSTCHQVRHDRVIGSALEQKIGSGLMGYTAGTCGTMSVVSATSAEFRRLFGPLLPNALGTRATALPRRRAVTGGTWPALRRCNRPAQLYCLRAGGAVHRRLVAGAV